MREDRRTARRLEASGFFRQHSRKLYDETGRGEDGGKSRGEIRLYGAKHWRMCVCVCAGESKWNDFCSRTSKIRYLH